MASETRGDGEKRAERILTISLAVIALLAGASAPWIVQLLFPLFPQPQKPESPATPGSGSPSGQPTGLIANLILASRDLRPFSSPEELRSALQRISEDQQIHESMGFPEVFTTVPLEGRPAPLISTAAAPPAQASQGPVGFYTSTNVQVAGVDEPDIVKTDGRIVVVASGSRVYIVGISQGSVLSRIELESPARGLLLEGNRLLVVSSQPLLLEGPGSPIPLIASPITPLPYRGVRAEIYDIKDPSKPVRLFRLDVSGFLAGARLLNTTAYLVISSPLLVGEEAMPTINGTPIPPENLFKIDSSPTTYNTIVALDLESLRYSASSLMMGQSSWIYMSPGRLYILSSRQPGVLDALSRVLTALARRLPENVSTIVRTQLERGEVASALAAASSYLSALGDQRASELVATASREASSLLLSDSTKIYAIDLDGLRARYRGSIEVPGLVLDQFSFEEMGRYIVVATTSRKYSIEASWAPQSLPNTAPPGGGNLTVRVTICYDGTCTTETRSVIEIRKQPALGEEPRPRGLVLASVRAAGDVSNNIFTADLESMSVRASLRGLAQGERIYSSRLVGSTLYLVTFRQVDPLFAIDLSNPESPRILGFLKIPGFSEYLHPVGRDLLLGIGAENASLKISLFRVSDPSRLEEISKILLDRTSSAALYDHHAFTEIPGRGIVMIPVYSGASPGAPVSGIALVAVKGDSLGLKAILGHRDAMRTIAIERGGEVYIYTISPHSIKVFSLESLAQIGEIILR